MAKRFLDITIAGLGLVVALPVIAVLIVLARFDSPGPGLFRQLRVGRDERPFVCYKIRTMRLDAPNVATHLALPAHTTRIGAMLRRTKLDELPQLWNVTRGDMSLVGPRPCLPNQTRLIQERRRRGVFAVRPGITGLAQIEGIDMSEPERLATKDKDYVLNQSVKLDCIILMRTIIERFGQEKRG
ncbi:sugar transferase [Aliihoeflea sp. 40Bstr573]|uniref:sugar transferase n=1 Tax=Aliihoeflea sp. 40Bstr573 TaxID=2696467 RepID=UPI002095E8CE|nr:sugar transferase [Aliihoeflea sp. 40Bstr573]MCO6387494.1 sugar transferase [Aliihoeflea sp. 40Bstr573]